MSKQSAHRLPVHKGRKFAPAPSTGDPACGTPEERLNDPDVKNSCASPQPAWKVAKVLVAEPLQAAQGAGTRGVPVHVVVDRRKERGKPAAEVVDVESTLFSKAPILEDGSSQECRETLPRACTVLVWPEQPL